VKRKVSWAALIWVAKKQPKCYGKIGVLKAAQKKCGEKRKYHKDSTTFHAMLANTHPTDRLHQPHKTHAIQTYLTLYSNFMVELGFFPHWT
jgi:hypothetical protein